MAHDTIVRSFEDLEVYQRAYRLALELHKLSLSFPKIEQFALADQVRRAQRNLRQHRRGLCASAQLDRRLSALHRDGLWLER